jgi:TRAP transporter TAXI family solute receptor
MNSIGLCLKRLGILTIIVTLSFVGVAFDATAKTQYLIIGGGNTGGLYYPMAGVLASLANKNLKGYRASAEVTGASVDNCIYVGEKKMDIGISNSDVILSANNGEKPVFKKKYTLEVLFETFTSTIMFYVLNDSPYKSIGDLKGKKISVGSPGSATILKAKMALEAYGISFDDIKPAYLTFSEGVDSLIDHNIDALVLMSPARTSAAIDLTTRANVRMLPLDDAARDRITKKHPYMSKVTIPGGILKGVTKDVPTVATGNPFFVHKDFDATLAYNFVKMVADNLDYIHRVVPTLKGELTLQNMTTAPKILPYHPGAIKYYKEKKVMQ